MAGKLDDDGIELFLKKTLLTTPRILPSPCSVDEQDKFPSFYKPFSPRPITDLFPVDTNDWHGVLLWTKSK